MTPYAARDLYRGETATSYDAIRTTGAARRRWDRELLLVETIVQSFPTGSRVLDLPCGTGRFHPLLAKYGCNLVGGDISLDMMRQARRASSRAGRIAALVSCDAEQLPFLDRSFDYVLCMRFFNLIPPGTAAAVLKEAGRISRHGVIVQVRFQGQNPLLRITADLRKSAGRMIRRQAEGASVEVQQSSPGASKRFPLPEFESFVDMARLAGLAVTSVHHAGPLLEPDPLRICRLEHR